MHLLGVLHTLEVELIVLDTGLDSIKKSCLALKGCNSIWVLFLKKQFHKCV
jgi:hypothetical protein